MIACGDVYVDLHAVSLSDHRQALVFPNRETAVAYSQLVQTSPTSPYPSPTLISLVAGNSLNWDGKNWTIVNVGDAVIGLINMDHFFTELPVTAFERLLGEGRITGVVDGSVRLRMKSSCAILYNFPELAGALVNRTKENQQKCLEQARLALESALAEVPPLSVPEVGRRMNIGTTKLYNHFPDLYRQVAANYLAYRHQRSIIRKEDAKNPKMTKLV